MKVSERVALTERVARALVWSELPQTTRDSARARAVAVVDEIDQGYRDHDAIAWILLDPVEETES